MNRDELLAAYDAQVRMSLANRPPVGVTCERDGPLLHCYGLHRGFVSYRSLEGADVDALIGRASCRERVSKQV